MTDSDGFRQLLDSFGIEPAAPSDELRRMLVSHQIPPAGQEVLFRHLMSEPLELGGTLFPEDGVRGCNAEDYCPLLQNGLIAVGWCGNGDFIAMDLTGRIGAIGYVNHDQLWEPKDSRVAFHLVAENLTEFIVLSNQERMPYDYYDALRNFPNFGKS